MSRKPATTAAAETSEFDDLDAVKDTDDTFEAGGTADTEEGDGPEINLSETDSLYTPLPRGIYDATVDELTFGYSQRSNNPMWTWRFEIEGGEFAGRKLFYHTVFNEGGMPRVKRTLARIKTESGAEQRLLETSFLPGKVATDGELIGARCRLRVDIRSYDGEKRNEIKDVLAPTAATGFDD